MPDKLLCKVWGFLCPHQPSCYRNSEVPDGNHHSRICVYLSAAINTVTKSNLGKNCLLSFYNSRKVRQELEAGTCAEIIKKVAFWLALHDSF